MKQIVHVCAIAMLIAFTTSLHAQVYSGNDATKRIPGSDLIRFSDPKGNPDYIRLKDGYEVDMSKMDPWLRAIFHLDANSSWRLISLESDKIGDVHYRYQQTWQQIPVRDAIFIVHTRNGKIFSVNGMLYSNINVSNAYSFSEDKAMTYALNYIHASKYKWENPSEEAWYKKITHNENATYYPKGEKVLVYNNNNGYSYAWKFDIYAAQPLSRQDVYVDAMNGEVILSLNKLFTTDVHGTAVTRYSGTQPIITDSTSPGNYRLRESDRGNGIQTFNLATGTAYANAVDFTDADNYWNNVNASQDEVAGDAHWGAEKTYDYYWNMHGRNSIDNNGFALISYVHYDVNYNNAFWDGTEMNYGDGDGTTLTPFTSLDICGHEITHGLTSFTANLDYSNEPGAMNEGFSDIFGTCIEFYAKPATANWTLGEDIGSVLRSLSDPNSTGNPDTYQGTNWDFATQEVHNNSTVLSHWFYLLSQGGTGTNDIGNTYSVTAQGITKASDIAFRTLTVYLTTSSQYADARFYSNIAAGDLYGGCSAEVEATVDAWYAVGVGGPYVSTVVPDFTADYTSLCTAPVSIQFTNNTVNANTYLWDFGDGTNSTASNPSHTYTANGNYDVKLVGYGGTCGTDSIIKTNYISINTNNTAIVSMPMTGTGMQQNCCLGILYDSGGQNDYQDNTNSTITIAPTGAMNILLNIVSFSMEGDYDYLYVYDGPNTGSPLIGQYSSGVINTPPPATITSTTGAITIKQTSDQGVVQSGFEIHWQCSYPNTAPTPNFIADITATCIGVVQFTDLSTNGPLHWHWDFGDGTHDTVQNPLHAFASSGTFTIVLTVTNGFGNNSLTKTNYVTVSLPASPTAAGDTTCDSTSATLTGSGAGQLNWFDVAIGGTPLDTGSVFLTPHLYNTTTFYVEDRIVGPSTYGGLTDNSGAGGYFTYPNQQGLSFNCTQTCVLTSVKVYAQGAATRTFTLVDSTGAIMLSGTYNIPDGESRVAMNWNIPVRNKMTLMGPGSPYLFRNGATNGPNLGYPFNIGGKISIYQSTAGGQNALAYYYFFYNWETKDPVCISARIPVVATVIGCAGLPEIPGISKLSVGPNPAYGYINIRYTGNESAIMNVYVINVLGQTVLQKSFIQHTGANTTAVDVKDLSTGIYFLRIENLKGATIVRIVKE